MNNTIDNESLNPERKFCPSPGNNEKKLHNTASKAQSQSKTQSCRVSQNSKYVSDAKKKIISIVNQCKKEKGNSFGELSMQTEIIKMKLGVEMLK